MREAKKLRKKNGRVKTWGREAREKKSVLLAPRISRGHFFAVFLRVAHDRLGESGTTRSLTLVHEHFFQRSFSPSFLAKSQPFFNKHRKTPLNTTQLSTTWSNLVNCTSCRHSSLQGPLISLCPRGQWTKELTQTRYEVIYVFVTIIYHLLPFTQTNRQFYYNT